MQQQWPSFKEVYRAWTTDHQHSLPSTNSQKDRDAPSLQTQASHWLCNSAKEGQTGCQSDKDCVTDHRLAVNKLDLPIQPACRPPSWNKTSRLDALEHSSEDVDESWSVFRDTIHSSTMDSLGPVSSKHQDWFDKEIQGLLEEKHQKHKAYLSDTSSISSKTAYSNICKTVQTRLRDMQDSWLSKRADEIQSYADRNDMKFFDAPKTVYGPQSSGTEPLLSADGTSFLTEKEAILKRWAEHSDGVLNRPSSINDAAINRLPQVKCNPTAWWAPVSETVKAIKLLSSGNTCRDLQNRRSSTYLKGKEILVCDSHRGISLLPVIGKILARVLLNWLNEQLNNQGFYQKASVDSGKTEEQ